MKKIVLVSTVLLLLPLMTACKDKPGNPVPEYGDRLLDSYEKAGAAADTANLQLIRRSIQQYHGAKGGYPPSLQALEAFTGIEIDAGSYEYDPRTGRISPR